MITLFRTLLSWIWSPEPVPLGCLSNEQIDRLESEEDEA